VLYFDGRLCVPSCVGKNKQKETGMKKLIAAVGVSLIAVVAMVLSVSAADDTGKKHGPHLVGTISAICPDCITVTTKKDGDVKIAMNDATKFGGRDEEKKCSDFKVGDKVMVAYKEDGDKKCATRVLTPKPHVAK